MHSTSSFGITTVLLLSMASCGTAANEPAATTLKAECNYAFRPRLTCIHKPHIRLMDATPTADEIGLDDSWTIHIPLEHSSFQLRSAQDLQDYLAVSMGLFLPIRPTKLSDMGNASHVILLGTLQDFGPMEGPLPQKVRGYRLTANAGQIRICGHDERGTAQGGYYLEDIMNLRLAPFIPRMDTVREPIFAPRMIHSGWGCDVFPDSILNAAAHAGIDAILVFVTGINKSGTAFLDFNDLIARAASYGLDVYFYSYFQNHMHPDEPGAEAYYDGIYGELIRHFPKVKGIVFVGESCEFPTKDEHAKSWLRLDPVPAGHENDNRPGPGWWPCRDYPQWLDVVKRVMRKHNPNLDIVFWTYNWGWAPVEPRLDLIRHLPQDISLEVTFEMFEDIVKDGVPTRCVDYTASFEGPGIYFRTEAMEAAKRKLPLYAMSNTGGLSWDIGVIPYEPIPYQWKRRWDALLAANRDWGLVGLMECHHYGWWPSFISELSKERYWTNGMDFDKHIRAIACRDFGDDGAENALSAWQDWSEAFRNYPPTNEDQYGPFRIGPAYPLLFLDQTIKIPDVPYAHFGAGICNPIYGFHDLGTVDGEIRLLEKMKSLMASGLQKLQRARETSPAGRREEADRLINLGDFIGHCVQTTIHTKKWYLLNYRLRSQKDLNVQERKDICQKLLALAQAEMANATATIPCVERDSRLGWEPSMEYMCDPEHLQWKLGVMKDIVENRIPAYLNALPKE